MGRYLAKGGCEFLNIQSLSPGRVADLGEVGRLGCPCSLSSWIMCFRCLIVRQTALRVLSRSGHGGGGVDDGLQSGVSRDCAGGNSTMDGNISLAGNGGYCVPSMGSARAHTGCACAHGYGGPSRSLQLERFFDSQSSSCCSFRQSSERGQEG